MIYRIVTEDKGNVQELVNLITPHFQGFNVTQGVGYYQGKKEAFVCFEIDTLEDDNKIAIHRLAVEIREYNKQECVLVQEIAAKSRLI